MVRSFSVLPFRSAAPVAALGVSALVLAYGALSSACTPPVPADAAPASTPTAVPHPPAHIIDVLPDGSPTRLAEAKVLADAVVQVLEPGDEIILVRGDFSLVVSQVVPGTRSDSAEVANCAKASAEVGGVSPRCQVLALGERQLQQWRASLIQQIEGVRAKPEAQTPAADCRIGSGWPTQKVLQLLLAFASDQDPTLDILILGGGDADARGNAPRLPAALVHRVEIVDAPYSETCGSQSPTNVQDWFQDAASVRVFSAERPASEFPQFLFQTSPSTLAGEAR